ncbi:MAG: hypothetical protein A2W90_24130 [Bacteroidetes bacterium GWF2_42_66]|nr:MAG: hypothetical protein A2W92_15240 [Bacteroidetes bacterium GWA2_42_15]OFX97982.1 MAG: hypothetical protein A2W89_07975 [Bacteroidetes bacterium GWE2_42_39]OFY45781.1 MAG: hypothetical protein A2W90_24130 [Bacteroidetes bacterium GWF2_42_66]HBL74722.1 hypothetical protein [Prolixibacteraceae bacterium]HCR89399.1 hypothetical protein [Prolixibacteraceae bacterium]
MKTKSTLIIVAGLIAAFALNALITGRAIQRFKKEDRAISVKGFSEREVKSDLALWTIQCRVANNNLMEGSQLIEDAKNKVVDFLINNNIKPDEIIQKDLVVNDKMAQEYGNFDSNNNLRYIIDKVIQVRSNNVDNIQKVSRMTDELLKVGVILNNQYGGAVRYYFTKLNEVKPAMLTEATKNAYNAAIQFTSESQVKLGKLKRASQGLFSIVDRDESLSGQGDGFYMPNTMDIYKKVRVVVSVEYSVE